MDPFGLMTRREALVRAAYLLGGTLSASTVAGVLAGCAAPREIAGGWIPRTLSPRQSELVLILGEQILPETDTPGARTAQVDRFIDAMLTDYYRDEERRRFLRGLERVEARARAAYGSAVGELDPARQSELALALNRAAYRPRREAAPVPAEQAARPADPVLQENNVQTGNETALPAVERDWAPEDEGPAAFFRRLKELVIVGYYTSQPGATQELRPNPMGIWRADLPYAEVGRAWS